MPQMTLMAANKSQPRTLTHSTIRTLTRLTCGVPDWSGEEYSVVSDLQRTVASDAVSGLRLNGQEWVLDIGCGDGFLTRAVADMVPDGYVVGVDPSPRMLTTAHAVPEARESGPRFVRADARRLPLQPRFDVVV